MARARALYAAVILFVLAGVLPAASAAEKGHLKLLAVSEGGGGYTGSLADLYLTISPGEGRVFIDTYPLTKLDTQISTRFAKEVACSLLEMDCSAYDFIYTIEAQTSIVGGPSAGAAISALTAAMLAGLEINESVALTGTINSGGLVGPVAGLKEKIEAAATSGEIKMVLIPQGERFLKVDDRTLDLVEFGGMLGITVKEVAHLHEVVFELTGEQVGREAGSLERDESYSLIMNQLADELCRQNRGLVPGINSSTVEMYNESGMLEEMGNLTAKAQDALAAEDFYSAASYCFGANVRARYLVLLSGSLSQADLRNVLSQAEQMLRQRQAELEQHELHTITDLQTLLVVQERLDEGRDYLDDAEEKLSLAAASNSSAAERDAIYSLGFGIERIRSADSWSRFFDSGGKEFTVDNQTMRRSCLEKLAEAEERMQYLLMVAPATASLAQVEFRDAETARDAAEYGRCLFLASKSKARANLLLGILGVEKENLDQLISNKETAVERTVLVAVDKGIFPLLGYSYLEYAKNLRQDEPESALLYLEFAQELSNFDLYFPPEKKWRIPPPTRDEILTFTIGLLSGLLLANVLKPRSAFPAGKSSGRKKKFPKG